MIIINRPYHDDRDLPRMRAFLADHWRVFGPAGGYFHPGDLLWWRRALFIDFAPEERVALWEGPDGALLGFAWFYPHHCSVVLMVHRDRRGEGTIERLMLAWAEERRQTLDDPPPLSVSVFGDGDPIRPIVVAEGFAPTDQQPMLCLARDLAVPIPDVAPAAGFTVRHVGGEEEFAERVAVHRDVWIPPNFTIEAYRTIRALDGFAPDLDLVAVAPDGRIAAYAIAWPDDVSGTAEFEPVGARAEFRRRGLTQAVLYEGLRRMRARGLHTGFVCCNTDPACALYHSVGFREVGREETYQRVEGGPR
ncbi:MAG: GNAT family N-acetyltransferase [Thermomicrobiales bacterium]